MSGNVLYELGRLPGDALRAFHGLETHQEAWGIRFYAPNHQYLDLPFPRKKHVRTAPGFVMPRVEFDAYLFQRAQTTSGITIYSGESVQDVHVDRQGVEVQTTHHQLQGELLVGADGAQSIVRRQLISYTKLDRRHHCAGLRVYYEGVMDFATPASIELHFLPELLPGYFWMFPLPGGKANVGLGMLSSVVSRRRLNLRHLLNNIIYEHPTIAPRFRHARALESIKGFGLPLGSVRRQLSGERFMLVGDAASLIDPFSGEGIGNALQSGRIAAQHAVHCITEQRYSAADLRQYDEAVYTKMGMELRVSRGLQQLARFPGLFNFVVKKANRNPEVRRLLMSMYDDVDLKRELTRPGFYVRLLTSRGG